MSHGCDDGDDGFEGQKGVDFSKSSSVPSLFSGAVSSVVVLQGAYSHWPCGLPNTQSTVVSYAFLDVSLHLQLLPLWRESYWPLSYPPGQRSESNTSLCSSLCFLL